MARPRAFDEEQAVSAAATLFAQRPYDGVSVDDLVASLGVHRNSLYRTFGSKRGLYLAALRRHMQIQVLPLAAAIERAGAPAQAARLIEDADLDLVLMAAVERAPCDAQVAALVGEVLDAIDSALRTVLPGSQAAAAGAFTAALLGLRLRGRATGSPTESDRAALARRFDTEEGASPHGTH